MKNNSIAPLVLAALAVAVLSTLMVNGGWMIWFPILLALAGTAYVASRVSR